MSKYSATINLAAVTTSFKTAGHVRAPGTTMRRIKIYEFEFGATAAPNATDTNLQVDISRSTANGTDTAFTPNPLDPAEAACSATFGQNASAEPTVTANSSLWNFGLNQRASYRWIAKDGCELVIPATANAGAPLRVLSPAYTANFGGVLFFDE